jgi:regulator of protease activity HflC (stomatin/prohibitin superfamily)
MNALVRICQVIVIGTVLTWLIPEACTAKVEPGEIGVRQSAASGVLGEDLGPGWHWRIPGVHKMTTLPSSYFMLDFTADDNGPQKPLVIRTKDNNTVEIDISVPVRIQ